MNSAARGERSEGVCGTSGSIARGDGWAMVNCDGDWPQRRGNWRSPRGPLRRLRRLLKPAGRGGEGVDKAVAGRLGESVISVSLISEAAGGWEGRSSVIKSMDFGRDAGDGISLFTNSLFNSFAPCCASYPFSFPRKDSSSTDGRDSVIPGPKSIFGNEMPVESYLSSVRSLAISRRSLVTPTAGAGGSCSRIPSCSIIEGESTISVSEPEIFGRDTEVGKDSSEKMVPFSGAGDLWPGDHCISGGADDGPGVMSPEEVGTS